MLNTGDKVRVVGAQPGIKEMQDRIGEIHIITGAITNCLWYTIDDDGFFAWSESWLEPVEDDIELDTSVLFT